MKISDFTDLELSYEVHTFRIGRGGEWSLLTMYEGRTMILNGVLCHEIARKSQNIHIVHGISFIDL